MPISPIGPSLPASAPAPVRPAGVEGFKQTLERRLAALEEGAGPAAGLGPQGFPQVPPAPPTAPASAERVGALLESTLQRQGQLNQILAQAQGGRLFSPQELLVLQARVGAATFELELASKALEQASAGVRQTLQTQV